VREDSQECRSCKRKSFEAFEDLEILGQARKKAQKKLRRSNDSRQIGWRRKRSGPLRIYVQEELRGAYTGGDRQPSDLI
jgi:hypothetical protein